ncbi:hypothetical protein L6452_42357 [Arctium lappa]|uniref:Uncharacterized protein n=1 Tax=Arctium lappa TaxID=4217 RepID=A0ACB8XIQ0_ARCLA|nr:hypothetical protein L6452_42357 [Arctium lappa]
MGDGAMLSLPSVRSQDKCMREGRSVSENSRNKKMQETLKEGPLAPAQAMHAANKASAQAMHEGVQKAMGELDGAQMENSKDKGKDCKGKP